MRKNRQLINQIMLKLLLTLLEKVTLGYVTSSPENEGRLKTAFITIVLSSLIVWLTLTFSSCAGLTGFFQFRGSLQADADTSANIVYPLQADPNTFSASRESQLSDSLLQISTSDTLLIPDAQSSTRMEFRPLYLDTIDVNSRKGTSLPSRTMNSTMITPIIYDSLKRSIPPLLTVIPKLNNDKLLSQKNSSIKLKTSSMNPLLPSLVGLGGNLIGGIFGATSQSGANSANMEIARMNNEYNSQMQDKQNAYNLEMWRLQNDYNSPTSITQRWKEAGWNPAMMMQNGGSTPMAGPIQTESPKAAQSAHVLPANYFQGVAEGLNTAISTLIANTRIGLQSETVAQRREVLPHQIDLLNKQAGLTSAKMTVERLRPEVIEKQIESLRIGNLTKSFQSQSASLRYDYDFATQRDRINLVRNLRETSDKNLRLLAVKVAYAASMADANIRNKNASTAHIYQAIKNLKAGIPLKEVQTKLLNVNYDWSTVDRVTGILGSVLGAASKFK